MGAAIDSTFIKEIFHFSEYPSCILGIRILIQQLLPLHKDGVGKATAIQNRPGERERFRPAYALYERDLD